MQMQTREDRERKPGERRLRALTPGRGGARKLRALWRLGLPAATLLRTAGASRRLRKPLRGVGVAPAHGRGPFPEEACRLSSNPPGFSRRSGA